MSTIDQASHAAESTFWRECVSVPLQLWLGLAILAAVLSVTVIPGVFIVDDYNYLVNVVALRGARVTLPNTEGLSPSPELMFFDPMGPYQAVESTPVASAAPPLYAPLALPFSILGWRGLVALNTLAYLAVILMVFIHARRYSRSEATPWLAAGAIGLGAFLIEYAQGLWPHALSAACTTGGLFAAARLTENRRNLNAAVAGLLLGVAAGLRYQNAVIVAAVCLGLMIFARRRGPAVALFVIAAAIPLAVSSGINHARLDSWNPVSKGKGYLSLDPIGSTDKNFLLPGRLLWAHVVDYSVRPPLRGPGVSWDHYDPATGAHVINGAFTKKALIQSAPWTALALVVLALSWLPGTAMSEMQRGQLRFLSLPVGAVLAVFALAGPHRHDGLCFNERYLIELLPILALAFGWALDGRSLSRSSLVVGTVVGTIAVSAILLATPLGSWEGEDASLWRLRQQAILRIPIVLSIASTVLWFMSDKKPRIGLASASLVALLGMCLGWGMTIHAAQDLAGSRGIKITALNRTEALRPVLTDGSALVAYRSYTHSAGPLLLDRDIVVLDVYNDKGKDAPVLIRELLARGRRVYLVTTAIPTAMLEGIVAGLKIVPVKDQPLEIWELRVSEAEGFLSADPPR